MKYTYTTLLATVALTITVPTLTAVGQSSGLPDDLQTAFLLPNKVRSEPLKLDMVTWSSRNRTVEVERHRRSTEESPWTMTSQTLSTAFEISWVSARVTSEIGVLYVSGTYETGMSTIEKWQFIYGLDPIPSVNRSVLYQGTSVGIIASMALDLSGQKLFFVTYNPAKVYRISTQGLSSPNLIADATTIEELGTSPIWSMQRRIHAAEGPKYLLVDDRHNPGQDVPSNDWVITLNDPDSDGVIESHSVFTVAQWDAASLDHWSNWSD